MKFFTRDSVFKKIILSIIIAILCNFSIPVISYGNFDIVDPITTFLCQVPDGIFWILQTSFMNNSGDVLLSVHTDEPEKFGEEAKGIEELTEGVDADDFSAAPLYAVPGVGQLVRSSSYRI